MIAFVASLVGAGCEVAQAQDFFSQLFGGSRGFAPPPPPPPPMRFPFADEGPPPPMPRQEMRRARISSGATQAWCVRSCDGRYFPLSAGNQDPDDACHNLCPSCETSVVYGSTIDEAVTGKGKPYAELPNAFRYRTALAEGCTCNGRDPVGLATIPVEQDPTIRKGDLVAGADGLMVANGNAGRHATNFSPASAALRARYGSVPVLARE